MHISDFGYFLIKDISDFIDGTLIKDGHTKWAATLSRLLHRQVENLSLPSPPQRDVPTHILKQIAVRRVDDEAKRSKKVPYLCPSPTKPMSRQPLITLRLLSVLVGQHRQRAQQDGRVRLCAGKAVLDDDWFSLSLTHTYAPIAPQQDLPLETIVHHLSLIEFSIYQAIKARVMNDHPSRTLLASVLIALSLSPWERHHQPIELLNQSWNKPKLKYRYLSLSLYFSAGQWMARGDGRLTLPLRLVTFQGAERAQFHQALQHGVAVDVDQHPARGQAQEARPPHGQIRFHRLGTLPSPPNQS